MFTGLIEEIGTVAAVESTARGTRLRVSAARVLEDLEVGDSIAIDGCCLTVVEIAGGSLAADVVPETLARTTLGARQAGDPVNLERPLRLADRLGGHLVQGHVDGVGEVIAVREEGDGRRMTFRLPDRLARYVAEKGSLAIDGVSLTVAARAHATCDIAFIPHTLAHTVAGRYVPGRQVNLEVDLLARYVERLQSADGAATSVE